MYRRRFLTTSASLGTAALSGCTSGGDDIKDSDGDGVIDSQDYAPQDPEVQEKADVQDVTTAARKTESPTATATRTPSPTPTPTPEAPNRIRVDRGEFPETLSHFTEYGIDSATVRVHPEDPAFSGTTGRELWVVGLGLPDDSLYSKGHTTVTLGGSATRSTVDLDWESTPPDRPLYYGALLAPEGKTFDELTGSNTAYFHETDAFEIQRDGRTLERTSVPEIDGLGDEEGDSYGRTAREGEYALSFAGRTDGQSWGVDFTYFKSAYVGAVRRDHGRSRSEFVTYEMSSGFADEMAEILSEEAEANGFTGMREQVEFVIDFVQHLPYVPDDVSTPFDDYTKFGAETLVELGGDCEDTAILLASVLQAEPFGYDMVLIQPHGRRYLRR